MSTYGRDERICCSAGAARSAGYISRRRSVGGKPGVIGFGIMAVFWCTTGTLVYPHPMFAGEMSSRAPALDDPGNYALTFAAVTFWRLELDGLLRSKERLNFDIAFPIVAWSSWVL